MSFKKILYPACSLPNGNSVALSARHLIEKIENLAFLCQKFEKGRTGIPGGVNITKVIIRMGDVFRALNLYMLETGQKQRLLNFIAALEKISSPTTEEVPYELDVYHLQALGAQTIHGSPISFGLTACQVWFLLNCMAVQRFSVDSFGVFTFSTMHSASRNEDILLTSEEIYLLALKLKAYKAGVVSPCGDGPLYLSTSPSLSSVIINYDVNNTLEMHRVNLLWQVMDK